MDGQHQEADVASAAPSFPAPKGAELLARVKQRLAELKAERRSDPVSNPVERLGFELSREIDEGELSLGELAGLAHALVMHGYEERIRRLRTYIVPFAEGGEDRIRQTIRSLMKHDGKLVPFAEFQARVTEQPYGIVFTAHPTFAVPGILMEGIAQLATMSDHVGRPLSNTAHAQLIAKAIAADHTHAKAPTLTDELREASKVITRCRTAIDKAHRILLEEAHAAYPDQWQSLLPCLITLASWTGYDLDGRVDLSWADILKTRTESASAMARHYAERLAALSNFVRSSASIEIAALAAAARTCAEELAHISRDLAGAQGNMDVARDVGQRLAKLETTRFDCKHAAEELGRLLPLLSEDAQIEAQLIRTEMQNSGLGEARVHFRVNSVQVANALHGDIGLESAGGGGDNRRRLSRIDTLQNEVEIERVNLGSVIAEPTTARRMMMLASLIHRQIDPHTPIRFLIAECDSPFIVLSALYLARLFGVDGHLDISPLFETRAALERGPDLIERLLHDEHFRAYIKKRGRMAIQTGFSDGGRAIGQTSVSLAIERLRIKIADLLARARLPKIDLLIFDTHGESVGRGGHPGGLEGRFNYIDTPFSRGVMHDLGLTHLQESSFQGGDGYLLFGNPAIASATIGAVIDHWLAPPPPARDPFYANQDYSLEFFLDMSAFNEALAGDRNYVYWLSSWAQSVLPPSGSRAVSRPNEERKSIFDMRAIPHNAMLQQMGMLVNSLAGAGAALGNDPERAAEMYRSSARFRSLLELIARARAVSSIDAMGAYADLINPVKWLRRAALADDEDRSRRMRRVAKGLSDYGSYRQANAFMQRIVDDLLDLDRVLRHCGVPCALSSADIALDLMHAVRVTLARRILLLAAEIPSFTPRNDVDPKRLDRDLNMFDVPRTVETLRIVFPESPPLVVDDSFGGPATYKSDGQRGYHDLHKEVFEPLEACHAMLRDIGAAIAHEIGAFG